MKFLATGIYKTILIQIGIRFLFFETIMEMGIQ